MRGDLRGTAACRRDQRASTRSSAPVTRSSSASSSRSGRRRAARQSRARRSCRARRSTGSGEAAPAEVVRFTVSSTAGDQRRLRGSFYAATGAAIRDGYGRDKGSIQGLAGGRADVAGHLTRFPAPRDGARFPCVARRRAANALVAGRWASGRVWRPGRKLIPRCGPTAAQGAYLSAGVAGPPYLPFLCSALLQKSSAKLVGARAQALVDPSPRPARGVRVGSIVGSH